MCHEYFNPWHIAALAIGQDWLITPSLISQNVVQECRGPDVKSVLHTARACSLRTEWECKDRAVCGGGDSILAGTTWLATSAASE
jgi:hypothetical protein